MAGNVICSIVTEIENTIINNFSTNIKKDFIYGKKYSKSAKILVEIIIQVFKQLGIEYTIKSRLFVI